MLPNTFDWSIVVAYLLASLAIGVLSTKKAGSSAAEFFLSGRNMPWWLLGFSMVATTFSADTPNLVTDIVRQRGVAGNWAWWAFLLTGMLTVFVYAKLWRRSNVTTDVEFYELRYSGKPAAFLRGFRAIYLGVFFNVLIMASVTLAAIKIGAVMVGLTPLQTVLIAGGVTVVYSMLGGLTGVLLTDFFQFIMAMIGAMAAAVVALNVEEVGGLGGLLAHENVAGRLALLPDFADMDLAVSVFVIPLAVQWWSTWYPGAEPGGGGYIAQRMLAAKNETHATAATLLFNAAHYALRPWPWIVVALCSLAVFPNLTSLQAAFPHVEAAKLKDDLAYPAMLTFLPHGWLGLVLASLAAAYMSTIATHLNWGSSYVVNDFHRRFVRPGAGEKELVLVGRISTLVLMGLASALALWLENALQAFQIMLQVGAGTGLLFILRWFWWRINAFSELTAMIVSFAVAVFLQFWGAEGLKDWQKLLIGVGITTPCWLLATFLTPPASDETLRRFCRLIRPGGPGWRAVAARAAAAGRPIEGAGQPSGLPAGILCMALGCTAVYAALFATGYWIYSHRAPAAICTAAAVLAIVFLMAMWRRVNAKS